MNHALILIDGLGFLKGRTEPKRAFVFLASKMRVAKSKGRSLDSIAANISDPSREKLFGETFSSDLAKVLPDLAPQLSDELHKFLREAVA